LLALPPLVKAEKPGRTGNHGVRMEPHAKFQTIAIKATRQQFTSHITCVASLILGD